MTRRRPQTVEELLSRTCKDGDCTVWLGPCYPGGYGRVNHAGRQYGAHRLMFELINSIELTSEQVVCHRCDNPPCINPEHLWLGTHQENAVDMRDKCRGRQKISPEIALAIRENEAPTHVLATAYGLSRESIRRIKAGRTWVQRGSVDYVR